MRKLLLIFIILAILLIISEVVVTLFNKPIQTPNQISFGVSFSPDYAKSLGLDWKQTYLSILNDLKVKNLRLPTYWEDLELKPDQKDFSQIDYLIHEASQSGARIILVVGTKQPRWPECHIPTWALKLKPQERQQKTSDYIKSVITRYQSESSIWAWQVENEPFFQFGENCDPLSYQTLSQEIRMIKSLDSSRPVIVTDTGEWRPWILPMELSDILGISVYTMAYAPAIGNFHYPFNPTYYRVKSNLVRGIFAQNNQKTIITELQAEPWTEKFIGSTMLDSQLSLFSLTQFKNNIKLAQEIGFDSVYLWGVEWWYYMQLHQHPEYWNFVKTLF